MPREKPASRATATRQVGAKAGRPPGRPAATPPRSALPAAVASRTAPRIATTGRATTRSIASPRATPATATRQVGANVGRLPRHPPATSLPAAVASHTGTRSATTGRASRRSSARPARTQGATSPSLSPQHEASDLSEPLMPMPLPARDNNFAARSSVATGGPSTAEVAAEVVRQLQSQGLVMRSDIQPTAGPSTEPTPGPSAQPAIARVVSELTGEASQHSFNSISRPIDLHVDLKVKAKVQAGEFVDFNNLIIQSFNNTFQSEQHYSIQLAGNALEVVPKQKPAYIRTLEQWTSAFHIFVSIYTQAHPFATADLMKYAATIDTLAKRSSFSAAMFYDNNFRKWRQHQPTLEWGTVNTELYLQAVTIGMQSTPPPVGPSSPFVSGASHTRARCWEFTRSGSCSKHNCRFAHTCSICKGSHHARNCTANSQRGGMVGRGRGGRGTFPRFHQSTRQ